MAKPKPPKRLFKIEDCVFRSEDDRLKSPAERMRPMGCEHEDVIRNIG